MGNPASFCDAVAANVRKGTQNVCLGWDGNAADAATVCFDDFAKKLDEIKKTFKSLQSCLIAGSAVVSVPAVGPVFDEG